MITYCDGWFRAGKCATTIVNEDAARKLHESGKLYTVLVGDPHEPECFIDIRLENGHVGVGFLDKCLREFLAYDFQVIDDHRMFLVAATHREFSGDAEGTKKSTIYKFAPSGHVDVLCTENGSQRVGVANADVAGNWEEVPSFGAYERLAHKNREYGERVRAV